MSSWADVVSTAVVGTERRAVPPGVAAEVAAIMDGEVRAGTNEEQLLVAAGVLGAWRRAGAATPPGAGPLPHPAAEDERPVAPAKAVQLLELLLDGHTAVRTASTDLVADWLTRCERSGRRLPPATLPRVLDAATASAALRAPAVAAGGPRLRWLAARNPTWSWAAGDVPADAGPDHVWAVGSREERLALLTSLRDHDAARARALLAGTWGTESAADRARFVAVLATGLSPDDEPFLEAALDDRAKGVRAAAAALLAALPSSALGRRMAERLTPLVSVGTRETRIVRRVRRRLIVALPGELDAAAARDGIVSEGAPPGTGRRAWALIQMVGAAPLAFWEEKLQAGPAAIIELGAGSDELVTGWVRAATRQRNPAWAGLLLRYRPDPALLAGLPPEAAHRELVALLPGADEQGVSDLLAAAPRPWPPETSRAVVARLRSAKSRQGLPSVLPLLATALDPGAGSDVEAWVGALPGDDPGRGELRSLARTLSLRQAIASELGPAQPDAPSYLTDG